MCITYLGMYPKIHEKDTACARSSRPAYLKRPYPSKFLLPCHSQQQVFICLWRVPPQFTFAQKRAPIVGSISRSCGWSGAGRCNAAAPPHYSYLHSSQVSPTLASAKGGISPNHSDSASPITTESVAAHSDAYSSLTRHKTSSCTTPANFTTSSVAL
jgi:hypothetical protein